MGWLVEAETVVLRVRPLPRSLAMKVTLKSLVLVAIAAVAAIALPTAAMGKPNKHKQQEPNVVGAVYSQTNDVNNNEVVVFDRLSNGQLVPRGQVSTGGRGGLEDQHGCGANCPFLDTQGEVTLTRNER